jgi:hypothetical protein
VGPQEKKTQTGHFGVLNLKISSELKELGKLVPDFKFQEDLMERLPAPSIATFWL